MKIADVLKTQYVCLLDCSDKSTALSQLAKLLSDNNDSLEYDELLKALLHRESLMSTGLGEGLAVPHVRLEKLDQPAMAIGISRNGISDYGSLDSKPVHIMVMIAAPLGQHEVYLQLMAQTVEKLRNIQTRQTILDCNNSEEITKILIG